MPLRISITWGHQPPTPTVEERQPPPEPETATVVLYEVAARRLYEQVTRNNALDMKAAAAFSFGGTVLPITFGLLSVAERDLPTSALFISLLYAAGAAFIVILVCSIWAYLIRDLSLRPRLQSLQGYSDAYTREELRQWTASEYLLSIDDNGRKLSRKARLVGIALLFSLVEAVFLTFAAISTL